MKLLRHFQTKVEPEKPASKWKLSEEGKQNMQEFVKRNDFDIEVVYTSTEPKA